MYVYASSASGQGQWTAQIAGTQDYGVWHIGQVTGQQIVTHTFPTIDTLLSKFWSSNGVLQKTVQFPVAGGWPDPTGFDAYFLPNKWPSDADVPPYRSVHLYDVGPGQVSWVREFAPDKGAGSLHTPVPGDGWDVVQYRDAGSENTVKLLHLGRLECDIDKCAGIKTLNACDDGDPATLDWCKQTVGCTHLKVK